MAPSILSIKEITLLTSTNEITLIAEMQRDNLSYETTIGLSSTQLNLIINQLQKINPDFEVSELFLEEHVDYQTSMYSFMASKLENTCIPMACFDVNDELKQIRA
jgi:hypothetical protein